MQEAWIPEVILIFCGSLFLGYGVGAGYKYLSPYLSHARIVSNRVLFYALYRPLQGLFFIFGLYSSLNVLHRHVNMGHAFTIIPTIKNVALLIICVWFVLRLLSMAEKELIVNRSIKAADVARLDLIFKIMRMSVVVAGALVLLPMMNIDISGLLALGGVGGILVGLMAKDVLSNTVGGLMVYVDRPFAKGDWIRLPDRNVEGTVENIAWRLTAIRLFSHQLVYIPNAVFMTTPMENFSRMKRRRLSLQVDIRYQEAAQIIVITGTLMPEIGRALQALEGVDVTRAISITTTGFDSSSCHVLIKVYIKTGEQAHFPEMQQDILLTIFNAVSRGGFECAALAQK
jgi:MscS family membrane protein